ncbi:DMT family transporter [Mesobacillus jeotgali]|uniref:DMT family transporter n=1 Tax=Mesobacillus jeotgali TaxID=129985 RepID=UPI000C84BFDD|nr:EamA family transporter [Mesobacillus jeotgali]
MLANLSAFKNNQKGILFMILAAVCTSTGQLFWKVSEGQLSWSLFLGLVLYGLGAITMMVAFRYGKLSVLHPLMSISYVLAILLGQWFLQEALSLINYMGILFIIFGSILMGGETE